MTKAFGAYVKQARKEKPPTGGELLPVASTLEKEQSMQMELSAQLSSLSTHSMKPVRPTQKFNKRVKNRLNFEASMKPATNAKVADAKMAAAPSLKAEDIKKERERLRREGGGRPRTPMIISASPSTQNLAAGVSVLGAEASELEPSSSQVFPFMNEGDSGKPSAKPKVPRPKFSSVPMTFVNDGKRVGGSGSTNQLTKEQMAKLKATMIEKVDTKAEEDAEGEAAAEEGSTTTTAPPSVVAAEVASEKARSEASVALSDMSNKSKLADAGQDEETTSQLKAAIQKLSKQQVARWKDIIRTDTLTPASLEEHRRIANFNKTVAMLRERIYAKSSSSISAHFQALDLERKGALDKQEFRKALDAFNLGDCLNEQTAEMLMNSVNTGERGEEGLVNYTKFTEALRMGRIGYIHQPGKRLRIGPDPEKPFGTSAIKRSLPYGIMEDGEKNKKIFDSYLKNLYMHVEGQFKKYDENGNLTLKMEDFQKVLKQISTEKGLKLSDNEIEIVSEEVKKDNSGSVLYLDFLKGFKGNKGQDNFTLPEFLKPKTLRRSQSGHPWSWTVED
ncbi:hypothetical protein A3770_04p35050 [Chloropicon primus]|uniref:EF-hand domain-containing protein n=1 Tax=Chloropicon primus TaxID=1764295 RepID=A0A5B8MKK4_9CHLO|nr:hypothetical protein A3770_04p35050 [Chloropicon primus]|eukprot:QDZ20987.1 hypothetical protein A3770_04p35050 [Chloropicon primus]